MKFQNVKGKNVHFLTSKTLQYFGHARAGKMDTKVNVLRKDTVRINVI